MWTGYNNWFCHLQYTRHFWTLQNGWQLQAYLGPPLLAFDHSQVTGNKYSHRFWYEMKPWVTERTTGEDLLQLDQSSGWNIYDVIVGGSAWLMVRWMLDLFLIYNTQNVICLLLICQHTGKFTRLGQQLFPGVVFEALLYPLSIA